MSLPDIEQRFVASFGGESRSHREKLFAGLEEAIQSILRVKLPCQVCIDGSFLTKNPTPNDIDIVVLVDTDVQYLLNEDQRQIIDLLNTNHDFYCVDSTVFFNYPREHELFGSSLDPREVVEGYGLENGGEHLKGFVVIRVWETDVGLRICR